MHKICALLLISAISIVSTTTFLFGVEVICQLDGVFRFNVQHMEDDTIGDDKITSNDEFLARNKLFFYQTGYQNGDGFGNEYELSAKFSHNCTNNGQWLNYRHYLRDTPIKNGLEYVEYSLDLYNLEGKGRVGDWKFQ
uniref:Uncharacterized protein n=1 Tax=Caenorhabditis japonica TaxID=281687 RepID=A0A8R1IXB5_CAEJA